MRDIGAANLSFDFGKASVLLIDGSNLSMDVACQILSGFGFRKMHRCSTLEKAISVVAKTAVDLVLFDPYAFGPRAHEFVAQIRDGRLGNLIGVPILMVTGHTEVQNVTQAKMSGADFVVAKPYSPAVLLDRILWVAMSEGRRGELIAPATLVSAGGSGVELW